MNEFLKKLKKSVESGEINKDIVDHHYEVLHTADLNEKERKNKAEEKKAYENEISNFLFPVSGTTETPPKQNVQDRLEDLRYERELGIFTGDDVSTLNNVLNADELARIENMNREKRELIELNTAHIELLKKEIDEFNAKILKNNELIIYLQTEMDRL